MILSLTANTTLDQTVFIPSLTPGKTIRATQTVQSMGGKPADASWILGEVGIPSRALGFAGGATGKKMESLLNARGVQTDFIWMDTDTRINVVIVAEDTKSMTTITTTTMEVTPVALDRLRAQFAALLDTATVVVTGGTLPKGLTPEFYTEFIGMARAKGVPVVFDAAEPNLSAGVRAAPTYIKPNRDELGALVGGTITTVDDALAAGREVIARWGVSPIISLDSDGGLAVLPDRAYRIPAIPVEVVSAAGAGDGVLAGITASLHLGQPIEEGLRLGFACATAVCLQPGTADCRKADVERFLPMVELIAVG
jgi:1-phosphofructokinase family hexose kinase